ncbi:hypothetical protein ACIOMM_08705 [Streptomyces sp. NPDC087908]|uniref:hypothetical protein n=1 Tax=Streptomyces sp. NPDC087908 TaxID=3365820 RepID=UPI00380ABB27
MVGAVGRERVQEMTVGGGHLEPGEVNSTASTVSANLRGLSADTAARAAAV